MLGHTVRQPLQTLMAAAHASVTASPNSTQVCAVGVQRAPGSPQHELPLCAITAASPLLSVGS